MVVPTIYVVSVELVTGSVIRRLLSLLLVLLLVLFVWFEALNLPLFGAVIE